MDLDPSLRREHLIEQRPDRTDNSLPLKFGARCRLVGRALEYRAAQTQLAAERNGLLDEETVLAARTSTAAEREFFAGVTGDRIRPRAGLTCAATGGINNCLRSFSSRIAFKRELFEPRER
jgi:hypothetical protein